MKVKKSLAVILMVVLSLSVLSGCADLDDPRNISYGKDGQMYVFTVPLHSLETSSHSQVTKEWVEQNVGVKGPSLDSIYANRLFMYVRSVEINDTTCRYELVNGDFIYLEGDVWTYVTNGIAHTTKVGSDFTVAMELNEWLLVMQQYKDNLKGLLQSIGS